MKTQIKNIKKKQKADENMIDSMVERNNVNSNSVKNNPQTFNALTNRIIHYLRNGQKTANIEEVQKDIPDIKDNNEFLKYVNKNDKLRYDQNTRYFHIRNKYQIKNKEELIKEIKNAEYGIKEDDELLDSYQGIKKDLEILKRENTVKVIYNAEKERNVLFYRDIKDPIEEILVNKNYDEAINKLREFWNVEYIDLSKYENDPNRIRRKIKKDKERKRNINNKRRINTHLDLDDLLMG